MSMNNNDRTSDPFGPASDQQRSRLDQQEHRGEHGIGIDDELGESPSRTMTATQSTDSDQSDIDEAEAKLEDE